MKDTAIKALITLLFFHSVADASNQESATCLRDGIERSVELRVNNPSGVPCQVVYLRKTEQMPEQLMWFAEVDANYCKTKYDGFLEKLQTKLNWSCTPDTAASDEKSDLTAGKDSNLPIEDVLASLPKPIKPVETVDATTPDPIPEPLAADIPSTKPEQQANGFLRATPEPLAAQTQSPPDKPQLQPTRVTEPETRALAKARIENTGRSAIVEPLRQTEPLFQAALPSEFAASSLQSRLSAPTGLTKDTLENYLPSGFYALDSSHPHLGATDSCPAPGYFVWNTRNPQKPVFELGTKLEFEINIANMDSELETTILTLPMASTDEQATCTTRVRFSACQYPDYREGAGRWSLNNRSFDCSLTNSDAQNPVVHLALFQNRDHVAGDSECSSEQQIIHMAIATVSKDKQSTPVITPSHIELTMSTVAGKTHARCRYASTSTQ